MEQQGFLVYCAFSSSANGSCQPLPLCSTRDCRAGYPPFSSGKHNLRPDRPSYPIYVDEFAPVTDAPNGLAGRLGAVAEGQSARKPALPSAAIRCSGTQTTCA